MALAASLLQPNVISYEAPQAPVLEENTQITESPTPSPNVAQNAISGQIEATTSVYCSCVRTLTEYIPDAPQLNASDYPLNTITPKKGDVIKLIYPKAYHVAYITEITDEGYSVEEGNFKECEKTERVISKDDEHIVGFFNMDRQRLINGLTPIQRETLWHESNWSMYRPDGSIVRGKKGEWGVAQFMPSTWEELMDRRRRENVKPILLDKTNFEDQITMFKYGWDKGITWYGRPTSE